MGRKQAKSQEQAAEQAAELLRSQLNDTVREVASSRCSKLLLVTPVRAYWHAFVGMCQAQYCSLFYTRLEPIVLPSFEHSQLLSLIYRLRLAAQATIRAAKCTHHSAEHGGAAGPAARRCRRIRS